jgi:3-dehydroquinate synthase/2-deoxy-scyllo-inosose synthase
MLLLETGLQRDWKLRWRNPDPPHQKYSYQYHLRCGPDTWEELLAKLAGLSADRFVLVTDGAFPRSLAEDVQARITALAPCSLRCFPSGEQAKHLATVSHLANEALSAGATRRSVVIALGGGLAGNVAGLLAGLLMRGVRLVHLPTTLLAMSDSCLSLKQGVNSPLGKNHLGLFYAPAFVWSDLAFLEHLPAREIRSALCELIKNVLAIYPGQLAEVQSRLRPAADYSQEELAWFIDLCITAKSSVMASDALEKHWALVLEYGHTIGHALELFTQGAIPHGLAIGIGMVVEARIARMLGLLSDYEFAVHLRLLRANGAPTAIPSAVTADALLPILAQDNKRGYLTAQQGTVEMVLLTELGRPNISGGTVLTQVDLDLVREAINWSRVQSDAYPVSLNSTVALAPVLEGRRL